ncbi:hypothetical protein [Pseudoalteromonas lipolytica]|uniref:Lipoprotein n=1 Tax=Pseudoalteromonas lipolytica TaxID=570156 RepID=A0ABY1GHF5_9GAMM|nr:hypothetical protein [Pseudoalteromonas lipolytica]MBE0351882.1 hypothetical protein [Pseudoalteromonas lipolytica LMEB 39]SFT60280.1 hypothetical protein SAMN04487854_105223 [Pseudoalteromonas lipolytica]
MKLNFNYAWLLVFSLVVAGCGGGGADSSGSTNTSTGDGNSGGGATTTQPEITVSTVDCSDCEKSAEVNIMEITSDEAISAIDVSYQSGYVKVNSVLANKSGGTSFDANKQLTLTFSADQAGDYSVTLNKVKVGDTWYEQNKSVNVTIVETVVNGHVEFTLYTTNGTLINTIAPQQVEKGMKPNGLYVENFEVQNYLYDEQSNTLSEVSTLTLQADENGETNFSLAPGKYLSHFKAVRKFNDQLVSFELIVKHTVENNGSHFYTQFIYPRNVSSKLMESQKALYDDIADGSLMDMNLYNLRPGRYCTSWFDDSYSVVNINEKVSVTYNSFCYEAIAQTGDDIVLEYTQSSIAMKVALTQGDAQVGLLDFVNDTMQYDHQYTLGSNKLNFEFSEFAETGDVEFSFIDGKGLSNNFELTIKVME